VTGPRTTATHPGGHEGDAGGAPAGAPGLDTEPGGELGPGRRPARRSRGAPFALALGLVVAVAALATSAWMSLALGAVTLRPGEALDALFAFDGSMEHLVVRTLRLPRTIVATAVGACLAVSGALIQGLTRNPLAAPSILGINAGAALAVVAAVTGLGVLSPGVSTWIAFAGATLAGLTVIGLGNLGRSPGAPERLILAGAALTALLASLTTAVLLTSRSTLADVRFWLAGSVAGRDLELFYRIAPYAAAGLALALLLGRPITTLALGESVAVGLGQRTPAVKAGALAGAVLLAGSAVAMAGPITFVGLVVPNAVRLLVGGDYRWIVPYSAILGAALVVTADVSARVLLRPAELPVGVMTAVIGGPVFLQLVRSKGRPG